MFSLFVFFVARIEATNLLDHANAGIKLKSQ